MLHVVAIIRENLSSRALKQSKHMEMEKGDEIRFVKGTYSGLVGWKNKAKKKVKGSQMIPVIVLLEKIANGKDKVKATKVKRSSYRKRFSEATSKEQAAIQQHPDLELAMINLAAIWAQMGTTDLKNIVKLFTDELADAQQLQRKLKGKARYRFVEFPFKRQRDAEDCMSVDS